MRIFASTSPVPPFHVCPFSESCCGEEALSFIFGAIGFATFLPSLSSGFEMFLIILGGQNFTISRLLRITKSLLRPPLTKYFRNFRLGAYAPCSQEAGLNSARSYGAATLPPSRHRSFLAQLLAWSKAPWLGNHFLARKLGVSPAPPVRAREAGSRRKGPPWLPDLGQIPAR